MSKDYLPFKVGSTMLFRVDEDGETPFSAIEIIDSKKDEAAIIPTDTIMYAAEMAAFVVQACNSFDDLLEACKNAMAEIAIMDVSSLPRYDQDHYLKAIQTLSAAIAKARGA